MKKTLQIFLLTFSFLAIASQIRAQVICIMCFDQNDSISTGVNNLLINGGFENHTCIASTGVIGSPTSFCPNSTGYSCDLANWSCTGGGTSTYACIYDVITNKSMIQEGSNAVYMGNYYCNPCSNSASDTSCLINDDCTVSGPPAGFPFNPDPAFGGPVGVSIEQAVNGLSIGNTYVLEFWAGGEQYMTTPGLFAVNVGFGDTMMRNNNTPVGTGIGTRFLVVFNATAATHTIKFTNWGHICGNCTELVLDDVRLYTLAELSPSIQPCVGVQTLAMFSAPNDICPGTCTDFTNLSQNASSYLWNFPGSSTTASTDVNPTNICYNTPGNYSVILIANGVNGSDTLQLPNYITVYPYPPPQGITQIGDTLFANQGAVTYQWYRWGILIPGATDYFYVLTGSGDYNVVCTDVHGCEVEAVIFNVIASVGSATQMGELSVFPNPVANELIIRTDFLKNVPADITVYNLVGEKVLLAKMGETNPPEPARLDVSMLPASIYYFEIAGADKKLMGKFVKQ
jgi:hypothetical protein